MMECALWTALAGLFVLVRVEKRGDFGLKRRGQHEDRLKAEVIEIGLEKRSACVFEVR